MGVPEVTALAFTRIRGRSHAELHGRAIPEGTIERTVSLALLAFGVMTAAVFVLSFTEGRGAESVQTARASFLPVFFEVVSAFCTVGLTMDVSPSLSIAGKVQIIVLMFVGRLGPLSFFAALSLRARTHLRHVRPAQEDLIVG
ncbi:potassium transporter TrkG [Myxococcus sp. MxC21-1]|uniref:potassium transporter TrkG n=1 Tax=Myxococcus sp. MxC21-1 TaxID=3041439 RepID=UPI0029319022|nr:potassium transporter TrkG [Myxococcus sp. MxC21-1]WNZ60849.1 potassium transporter TrkG [Myxococcus sp. MxC21-1]